MSGVKLEKIVKSYGKIEVVHGIDLEVEETEFVVLVGPSGCGKSTTLRMIAGLEEISSGEISIDDRIVNRVAPKDRDVAMVFQNYALSPPLKVFENIAFGLRIRKESKEHINNTVAEVSEILGSLTDDLPNYQVVSDNAWLWGALSCDIQRCFYLMNHYPIWTQSCARKCVRKSSGCTNDSEQRRSMSRMIR